MNEQAIYYEIGGGLLLVLFGVGGAYIRLRRVRRWENLLASPARDVAEIRARKKGRPRWAKLLPDGLKLGKGTLFEAMYAHFDARPEMPVTGELNSALAEAETAKKPNVPKTRAPMSDEERVKSLLAPTDSSITVPSQAIAQNVVLHLLNVLKGKQKLTQGLEHAVWDSLTPSGGFAGAKLGGAVGLAVAPFVVGVASVLTPISVIAGAWLGAWTGKQVGARFKARKYLAVLKRLRNVSREFQRGFVRRFPEFLEELDRDYVLAAEVSRSRFRDSQGRIRRLFYPNLITIFCGQEIVRLRRDHVEDRKRMKHLLALVRAQDPLELASVLPILDPKLMKDYPDFQAHREEYLAAMREFEAIRSKDLRSAG